MIVWVVDDARDAWTNFNAWWAKKDEYLAQHPGLEVLSGGQIFQVLNRRPQLDNGLRQAMGLDPTRPTPTGVILYLDLDLRASAHIWDALEEVVGEAKREVMGRIKEQVTLTARRINSAEEGLAKMDGMAFLAAALLNDKIESCVVVLASKLSASEQLDCAQALIDIVKRPSFQVYKSDRKAPLALAGGAGGLHDRLSHVFSQSVRQARQSGLEPMLEKLQGRLHPPSSARGIREDFNDWRDTLANLLGLPSTDVDGLFDVRGKPARSVLSDAVYGLGADKLPQRRMTPATVWLLALAQHNRVGGGDWRTLFDVEPFLNLPGNAHDFHVGPAKDAPPDPRHRFARAVFDMFGHVFETSNEDGRGSNLSAVQWKLAADGSPVALDFHVRFSFFHPAPSSVAHNIHDIHAKTMDALFNVKADNGSTARTHSTSTAVWKVLTAQIVAGCAEDLSKISGGGWRFDLVNSGDSRSSILRLARPADVP